MSVINTRGFFDSNLVRALLLTVLWSKAISMVLGPQGVLMCWSSTLTILANSGPFHGLLLTILARFEVPERFSRLTIPRVCLHVRRQYSQFWRILTVSWTVTHCFGVTESFA